MSDNEEPSIFRMGEKKEEKGHDIGYPLREEMKRKEMKRKKMEREEMKRKRDVKYDVECSLTDLNTEQPKLKEAYDAMCSGNKSVKVNLPKDLSPDELLKIVEVFNMDGRNLMSELKQTSDVTKNLIEQHVDKIREQSLVLPLEERIEKCGYLSCTNGVKDLPGDDYQSAKFRHIL